jgi:hypothetical protein
LRDFSWSRLVKPGPLMGESGGDSPLVGGTIFGMTVQGLREMFTMCRLT